MALKSKRSQALCVCLFYLFTLLAPGQASLLRPVTELTQVPSALSSPRAPSTSPDGVFRFAESARAARQRFVDPYVLPADLRPPVRPSPGALWYSPGHSLISDWDADRPGDPVQVRRPSITVAAPAMHQYFVPFYDDDLWTLFAEINDNDPAIGQCLFSSRTSRTLNSVISVTSSSDGAVYHYDHWEDGYDADPLIPGPTTQVGMLDSGVTRVFQNLVLTPRSTSVLLYDGRDRITISGERATVMRAVYPQLPGERLAGAWEVPEVGDWGQEYVAVIGEDLDANGAVADDFDYVGLQVMAAQPGTQITVNGSLVTTTIEAGATVLVDGENDGPGGGGVHSGDVITASGPIQVQVLGAGCEAAFSARAYTLQSVDAWTTDYWAPVPDFDEGEWCDIDLDGAAGDDRDTDIYLHNHNPYPITVTLDDGAGGAVPLNVPASTTISVLAALGRDLSATIGAHLFSADRFWGVSAIDSTSAGSANSNSQHNDWGYSLIPVDRLSSRVVLGWSPGNSLSDPASNPIHNSGNLAFVSAFTDTLVFVDLDMGATASNGEGHTEAFDINGDGDADDLNVFGNPEFDERRSDDGITLGAGEVLRVADPNDNDLTGAMIYTRDLNQKIAVAWGQDPCRSQQAAPYLDLGYTVLAVPIPSLAKQATLPLDADVSGNVAPGATITYTVVVHNNGQGPMLNGVLTDTLPYTYTDFVVGSLAVQQPPPLGGGDYFNGLTGSWVYTPTATPDGDDPAVWALGLNWPALAGGEVATFTFRVRLDDDIPFQVDEICNRVAFCSDETGCTFAAVCTPIGQPDLRIDKLDQPDPVRAGELLTYTVVVSNVGDGRALGALIVDRLPPFVTYQPGSLNLTLPSLVGQVTTTSVPFSDTFTGNYADDFDLTDTQTSAYAGSDGSLAWSSDWMEVNDAAGPGPGAGDVQVGALITDSLSPPGYLQLTDSDNLSSGVTRALDLSRFVSPMLRFFVSGINAPGDDYQVRLNGIPLFSESFAGDYERRVLDLSPYAGSPATLGFLIGVNVGGGQAYRFDNIRVVEASPLRSGIRTLTDTIGILTYTTTTGIDPLAYDPVTNIMTVTNPLPIPSGAQVRFSYQVQVTAPLTNGLGLWNTAAVTSTDVVSPSFPLQDDVRTSVVSDHALTLTKTGQPDTVYIGQWITYTLLWEVGGNEPAPGVVVSDTLPWPYAAFVGCQGGLGCTFTPPDTVVWDLGDRLPPASGVLYDSGWLTLTVRTQQNPPGGVFTNTAVLDDATDVPPDWDDEPTQVINAGFALDKRRLLPVGDSAKISDTVQFRIVISNTGALTVTRLPLADTYDPVYLAYQQASPPPDAAAPGLLAWDDLIVGLGRELAPGESIALTVTFTAISSTQHLLPPMTVNTAVSDGAQTVAGRLPRIGDEDAVGIKGPGLALSKRRLLPLSGAASVNDTVRFRILISNTGVLTVTRLPLADTYDPVYLTYQQSSPPPDAVSPGLLAWDDLTLVLGRGLAPDESVAVTVTFTATASTQHLVPPVTVNTAVIDGAETAIGRLPPLQDEDVVEIQGPPPGCGLSKQRILPVTGTARVSDTVQFRILITNTEALSITHLPLADTYDPVYLMYKEASPLPDDVAPGLLTWDNLTVGLGRDLAPGESFALTVTFTATASTKDLVPPVTVNTAVSDGARTAAGRLPRLQDQDDVAIEPVTAIELLYLRAGPRSGGVWVEWATLLEIDTYGFWLYRGIDADLSRAVPVAFVAAQGWGGLGAVYSYLDADLPYGRYHYWLVEVENSGVMTPYGPVSAWPGWSDADRPYRVYLPLMTK